MGDAVILTHMPPPAPFELAIPPAVVAAFVAHARGELPNESCGFLAGRVGDGVGVVSRYLPVVNELQSPTAFATEPASLFAAFKAMRAAGDDVLGVVHSHPTTAAIPSRRDLDQNTYGPNVVWAIVSFADTEPVVRYWWLGATDYREA